jgi:hypothetical protein
MRECARRGKTSIPSVTTHDPMSLSCRSISGANVACNSMQTSQDDRPIRSNRAEVTVNPGFPSIRKLAAGWTRSAQGGGASPEFADLVTFSGPGITASLARPDLAVPRRLAMAMGICVCTSRHSRAEFLHTERMLLRSGSVKKVDGGCGRRFGPTNACETAGLTSCAGINYDHYRS